MSKEVLRTAELLDARGITAIVRERETVIVVPAANGQHEARTISIPEAARLIVQQIGNDAPTVELVEIALVIIGSEAQHYDKIARQRRQSYDSVEDGIVGAMFCFLHPCSMWDGAEGTLIFKLLSIIYRTDEDFSDSFPLSMYERILDGCSDKLRRAGINLRFAENHDGCRQVRLTRIPPCDECRKMQK